MRLFRWEVPEPGEWLIPYIPFFIGWAMFTYLWAWLGLDLPTSLLGPVFTMVGGYALYYVWPSFVLPDGFRPRLYVLEDQIGAIEEIVKKWDAGDRPYGKVDLDDDEFNNASSRAMDHIQKELEAGRD